MKKQLIINTFEAILTRCQKGFDLPDLLIHRGFEALEKLKNCNILELEATEEEEMEELLNKLFDSGKEDEAITLSNKILPDSDLSEKLTGIKISQL